MECYPHVLLLVVTLSGLLADVLKSNNGSNDKKVKVNCSALVTCGECISQRGCVFCRDQGWEGDRCGRREDIFSNTSCLNIEDPSNSVDYSATRNESLTTNYTEEYIQISPQHMKLRLRVGEAQEVKFQVAHALSYPVDLYYLMDLSNSMSDDRCSIY